MPPVEVETGPVKENILVGDDVDLFKFPTPKWHELDGGRYIGTGGIVIQKDPDTGWINLGTYRVQVHDKSVLTLHVVPGHHGDVIARKYWDRGLSCPVAVVCGSDPLLYNVSITSVPLGVSEYDYAGWLRGKPIQVVRGETVDLPIPAGAEIVLEGDFVPTEIESRMEGPFGEWRGYYAGGARPHPVIRVKAILHRNDPIIHGAPPLIGPYDNQYGKGIRHSADLWDELDKNLPGVKGVWMPDPGRGHPMAVISLKQEYAGDVKQAGLLAAGAYRGVAGGGRIIIIVDDDIDPSNTSEFLWALATRWDPATATDVISECTGGQSDPLLPPAKRDKGSNYWTTSRVLIYACKPYSWIEQFPVSIKTSPEDLDKVKERWGKALF